ncbi:hypothetical protein PsorP6_004836 [Peronosclerospora sorghi]|uniref:Uncharacterized protein n=1 Tax=Peronosclerospora sorghi TaxID=230839 RepID=A0ACC0VPC8_9STRA|nr:hypothetical protein PsorP6_004836 [Peronosclerospora sorghi]
MNAGQCVEMLHKLLGGEDDKSITVCSAVALLRLSDWMDEEENDIVERLLHEENALKARVVGLKIVGRELPELLRDGFLVYLLHYSTTAIVQAAVECCSNSPRNLRLLFASLMKHLSNSVIRSQIVASLKSFEPAVLWRPRTQYTEEMLHVTRRSYARGSHGIFDKRDGMAGALNVLDTCDFAFEAKLDFLLHLIETLLVASKDDGGNVAVTQNIF